MTEKSGSRRTVVVDASKCVGSTICIGLAPHSFEVGPDLKTVALNPFSDREEDILRAIEECPSGAISFAKDQA
jgi:ferredoxin